MNAFISPPTAFAFRALLGALVLAATLGAAGEARAQSDDATLRNVTLGDISDTLIVGDLLEPAFAPDTATYTLALPNLFSTLSVVPATNHHAATVTVNGNAPSFGFAYWVSLPAGAATTVNIVVTAEDGSTTATYTVTVTRAADDPANANLYILDLAIAGATPVPLIPRFDPGTTSYTATVPNSSAGLTITRVAQSATARVAGPASPTLSVGSNAVTWTVTAGDNSTMKTYTVTITREAARATNADLAAVQFDLFSTSISDLHKIANTFDAEKLAYTASVPGAYTHTRMRLSISDGGATGTVNGIATAHNTISALTPLHYGANVIPVVITASDGVTTKTYTFTLFRAAPVTALALSAGTLVPRFSAEVAAYAVAVEHAVTVTTVTATFAGAGITATAGLQGGTAASLTSGVASGDLALAVGENVIEVKVGASGNMATYRIRVTRAEAAGPVVAPREDAPPERITLRAVPGAGALTAAWDAPDAQPAITAYHLRWRAVGTSAWQPEAAGMTLAADATSYAIPNLPPATAYEIQARAVNSEGAGHWSASAHGALLGPPPAPTGLRATAGAAAMDLVWTAPLATGGADITGYRYRWSNDNDDTTWENAARAGETSADGLDISGSDASTVEYTLASLVNGTTYQVQIAAVNSNGTGEWSASAAGRPLATPGAPQGLEADPENAELLLVWMPPAETGGADAGELTYQVRWRADSATTFANADAATTGAGAVSHRITGLANGTIYLAQVRAHNDGGMSDWSEVRAAPAEFHIDFDSSGDAGWAEGVAVLRWILGLRGDALTNGLPGLEGAAARIARRLDAHRDDLDVDNSSGVTPADGIMIARHLMGVGAAHLLAGQSNASDAAAVQDAINALKP